MNILRFKLLFLVFIIFGVTICCSDEETIVLDSNYNEAEEMMNNYIVKSKDKTRSMEDRIMDANNALYWCLKLPESEERKKNMSSIGLIFYSLKEYGKFKKVNDDVLVFSKKIRDSSSIAKAFSNIGSYYNVVNIKDSAFYNFFNAEKMYSQLKIKEPTEHGKVLYNMAFVQRYFKNYVGSEANTIEAIEEFKESNSNLYLYYCYNQLGVLSKDLGRYEEAIKNYQSALEYAKKIENGKYREIQALNNIGVIFKDQKLYSKAIEYYTEALSYEDILKKNKKFYALLLDNIAYAKFLSGERDGILSAYEEPMRIRDSIDDKQGLISNNIHIAEYYNSNNQDSISKIFALKSKSIAESIDSKKEVLNALLLLSEVSKEKEGLQYANQYIKLNDSLLNQERISRDKFARIRYETDEIVEQNQQISRENEILIIAILGLTALFLLGYIIFRQQQSNKELLFAQTQQESNEEIYRLFINQQIKLEEGRQLEQQRMSEELHDGVLGRLFGVRLSLDGINQRANDEFTESRNKYIEELKAIEKEIRLISHDLGAETLPSDVAYIDAVENLIKDLCEVHKLEFEFNNDEDIDWEEIDDQKKVNFFRILQESMQNIFKHAHADSIKINFDYVEDKINLTILDDGIGFRENKVKKGIGLKNITSRVSQMSGVVKFLSEVNSGTTVSVSVPV
ncbi:sensor histidine kinase [Aquimarina sp. AU119]|uniref:ATP-binding protein n=1 Tax=Aquimarina sp. AU119 TaxID=2108528 RepID=UPI000D690E8D|nr:sensor histidine kinase [Aquimarina sp. AU119]